MNLKLKQFIAREGLIILSLLVFSLFFFFIDNWIKNKIFNYRNGAMEIELVKEIPEKEKLIDKNMEKKEMRIVTPKHFFDFLPKSLGIKVQFPKEASNEFMESIIRRDFPHIKIIKWKINTDNLDDIKVTKRYDLKGNPLFESVIYKIDYSYIFYFSLFFAYPSYWIIRFVIWSVKTIREK